MTVLVEWTFSTCRVFWLPSHLQSLKELHGVVWIRYRRRTGAARQRQGRGNTQERESWTSTGREHHLQDWTKKVINKLCFWSNCLDKWMFCWFSILMEKSRWETWIGVTATTVGSFTVPETVQISSKSIRIASSSEKPSTSSSLMSRNAFAIVEYGLSWSNLCWKKQTYQKIYPKHTKVVKTSSLHLLQTLLREQESSTFVFKIRNIDYRSNFVIINHSSSQHNNWSRDRSLVSDTHAVHLWNLRNPSLIQCFC